MKKVRVCLFSVIVFLLSLLGSVSLTFASNDAKGDIRIALTNLGTSVSGVTFKLYRVGTVESGVPKLDTQYGYSFYPETGEALDNLAKDLSTKVTAAESYVGVVDAQGKLEITGIADGVYLVQAQGTDTYGKISPFMLNLPYMDDISHVLTWVADIEPKASPNSVPTVAPTVAPTKAPEEPKPTEAPKPSEAPKPTETPENPEPTKVPEPTKAPENTEAPEEPEPTETPENPEPTDEPDTPEEPEPSVAPITQGAGDVANQYTETAPTSNTNNSAYNTNNSGETAMYSTNAVSTGDSTPIAVNIMLLLSSVALVGYIIGKRKGVK